MSDRPPWKITDVDEDELIEVRRPAGETALARVVSVDRSGEGIVTLRVEPAEAVYRRDEAARRAASGIAPEGR